MKTVLGIDIGSIAVSAALLDRDGNILHHGYDFHQGDTAGALVRMLGGFDIAGVGCVAATGAAADILNRPVGYDSRISYITASWKFHGKPGSLLIVGGEKFGLALFNERGEYMNYRSNTSCAAGTGSFLEQQAKRLNLKGIEEFSDISFGNTGVIPRIASRCSVFAKTDLIHAQQEGYSLGEICDGLCYGLAKNVADTLFYNTRILGPMVCAGGVSRNRAVVKHLSAMTNVEIITDRYSHVYGAVGAAQQAIEDGAPDRTDIRTAADIVVIRKKEKHYHYGPLSLTRSTYPEFDSIGRYEYRATRFPDLTPVEVDIYEPLPESGGLDAYLGIDIGSTSTKAVLVDASKKTVAGFYTRTSGRPVAALQSIFECIDAMADAGSFALKVLGAGTTGSGRRFIGEIIGADTVLDEITAHARAAYELDPAADTIIEIGGQDSKFTTLRNGMVTFSIMNNVCAAGTGSFIEEQAKKLGCPLSDYSRCAEGSQSPLSSDRCTVFMERDLNFYLSEGYSVNEILASVLHSVRDNYLTKVAIEKNIGSRVLFQGATAKNRALVAAFEQRLDRPITVSKFCHLTGAIGAALVMHDEGVTASRFRGIGIHRADIPIRTEVCDLCTNHCKIRLAEVNGETATFGFLCGRDYDTKKYVRDERLFDLLKARKKAFPVGDGPVRSDIIIGLPAALHLFEEIPMWRKFFQDLGLKTITSEGFRDAVKAGRQTAGAEFCAPLTALHGHVSSLIGKADYIFLPVYIEDPKTDRRYTRNYCYYTQYAPPVVSMSVARTHRERILSPVLRSTLSVYFQKLQLFRSLNRIEGFRVSIGRVSKAYDDARVFYRSGMERLQETFRDEMARADDIAVMFLGRPYTLLSRDMNGGITDLFAARGIRTFFQDMVPASKEDSAGIDPLLASLHWKYAARIMEATETVARTDGLYPVFVTSFKCTPDSYAVDYFKRAMDGHGKPYLILQLDEHDSSVGYETRIEAGIRAFRNHRKTPVRAGGAGAAAGSLFSCSKSELAGKTLLFPKWDGITCTLLEAVLKNSGIDARVVDETTEAIQRSMRMNTGQCIPLSIMIQNFVDYIERHGLDPAKTAVWTLNSQLACNIGMFPAYKKSYFQGYGNGMEKVAVYRGETLMTDMGLRTVFKTYLAYMFGGNLRKIGCSIRPYELEKGATDSAIQKSAGLLYDALLNDGPVEETLRDMVTAFESIPVKRVPKPKVAIFGDMYVRDNDVLNQGLISLIEEHGGEVVTTPYIELAKLVADVYIKKWFTIGKYKDAALASVLRRVIPATTRKYDRYFKNLIPRQKTAKKRSPREILGQYRLEIFLTGESMENILKIAHLMETHRDLALLVQTNPSYCCPSLVTEAMADRIEEITGIPIVTIEYDGTGGSKNDDIIPYLRYLRQSAKG